MGVITRTMKSVFFSASSCRRMMSSSSSFAGYKKKDDLFLVSHFTHETNAHYFSLVSTENWATVRDFHSPYFGGIGINMSSCEGLVLLHHAPNEERLWDPWTNDFKLLPPSYVPRPPNKAYYRCSCAVGFGFDSKSHDYKIIRFVHNYFEDDIYCDTRDGQLQIELYSLKNDSWKEIFDDPTHPCFSCDRLSSWRSCYANGCCYWTTMENNVLLSFDFANESFSSFSLPKTGCECMLVEFDGSLGVIVDVSSREILGRLDVELWVWNDQSWTRKFEIHVAGAWFYQILGFSSDNQLLFLQGERSGVCKEFTWLPISQLLAYDLRTQQIKKFDIFDYSDEQDMKVFPCFDSKVAFSGKSGIFDIYNDYDDYDMEAYFDSKDAFNGKSRICDA